MPDIDKNTLFILLTVIVGWLFNVISAITYTGDITDSFYSLRLVGIIAFPLGSVLGYIPNP